MLKVLSNSSLSKIVIATLKSGVTFQTFIPHPYRCQSNIIRKISKSTLFEQTSIFKTNSNSGGSQKMNIVPKRPIAFKISENDL